MAYNDYPLALKNQFLTLYEEGLDVPTISKRLNLSPHDAKKIELILKLRQHSNYTNLKGEIWKPLTHIGFPLYFVSNKGRVRRLNRLKFPKANRDGYAEINLYRLNEFKTITIHRLVLVAFTGDRPGMTINHKDYNRMNNELVNLEWMTIQDNLKHRDRNPSRLLRK